MRRILPPLLLAAILTGCAAAPAASAAPTPAPTPAPGQFVFTRDNFPRLDGSTATVPLGQAVAAVLLGESREEAADLVQFNKTDGAYDNLTYANADLLLVAEGSERAYVLRDELGLKWDMEPFAREGLVFMVNADNPVDGLTSEQVRDIYAGKIANWKDVGGGDREILPFQRPDAGGSQSIMLKEVMGDTPIMAPANEGMTILTMGGLIDTLRSYDDSPGAIGYTVYYYANDMEMADGLKLLTIDGVAPSAETIRDGSYPFRTSYYVVKSATAAADSPTGVLYDWMLSQEGQDLVAGEGYVSVLEPSR